MDLIPGAKVIRAAGDLASAAKATQAGANACKRASSFVPGTKVLMADGTTKSIEDIQVADKVLATDPATDQTEPKTVVGTITTQGQKDLVKLTVNTGGPIGDKLGTFVATANHPIWLADEGRWIRANELDTGDDLRTASGARAEIEAASTNTRDQRVHNLTIKDIHTYYVVAGEIPVLVHNCGSGEVPYFGAYPKEFLEQAAKYGKGGVKGLPDGRIRFYGEFSEARTSGEMVGRRLVREWNPDTGATRIWHETLDHAGNVRIVRPDVGVTGGNKVHYMFDVDGKFTGSW